MSDHLPEGNHLLTWPIVPEDQRPKPLYVDYPVADEVIVSLLVKGWKVQDIRLIDDEAESLEALFTGVRHGSIHRHRDDSKFLELESRALGLTQVKERRESKQKERERKDVSELLAAFGTKRSIEVGAVEKAFVPPKNRGGRPKGQKNKKRKGPLVGAALHSKVKKLKEAGKFDEAAELIAVSTGQKTVNQKGS